MSMKTTIRVLEDSSKPGHFGWSFSVNGSLFSEGGYVSEEAAKKAAEEALSFLVEDEPLDAKAIVDRMLDS